MIFVSNFESPSIFMESIVTSEVSFNRWMYKVPFFNPNTFPVKCRLFLDSFSEQANIVDSATRANTVFFISIFNLPQNKEKC